MRKLGRYSLNYPYIFFELPLKIKEMLSIVPVTSI